MPRTKEFDETVVLDKAVALFWQKGFNGISAQDLVDGLGLSRSSLYDTFGDKHTLFVKALQRYRDKETDQIIQQLDNATDIPATIKAILLANEAAGATAADCGKGCFMVNSRVELAPHDPEIATMVKDNWKALEDAFYRALKRGQENGQIATVQPARALARFLVNNTWGLSVYGKADADRKVSADIIKVVLSVL